MMKQRARERAQRAHGNSQKIAGYCPMGCGQTLFVGNEGAVTCSALACSRPDAVHVILSDAEYNHVVIFGVKHFSIKHPLRERCDDEFMDCSLLKYLRGLSRPVFRPGRYSAVLHEGHWRFTPLI
jgi:hypothetical protein